MDTRESEPAREPQGVTVAYTLHKHIEQTEQRIQGVKAEISKTHLAERLAFIGTTLVYFIFIWSLYINDLWGFATWLEANKSEVFALCVLSVLGVTMPIAMAYIKSIAYHHLALYEVGQGRLYAIVFFLMFAGMVYEAISSSGQQQHIAHTGAESSKTFQAVMGTQSAIGVNNGLITDIAKAEAKLSQCKERLARGKEKHCNGAQANVNSLKQSLNSSNQLALAANTQAIEAKAKAASDMKEENFKPVYKFARDVFNVTISTGVVMVAVMVSIIFEISHGLLVLFMSQKDRYLKGLEAQLIAMQAQYLDGTGKVHDSEDFADGSILDMNDLRESGEIKKNGVGFMADIKPVTAYQPVQPAYHQTHDVPRAQSTLFGFGLASAYGRQVPSVHAGYSGLSALALLDKKALAKSRARNQTAECPACGKQYIKHHSGQIFCRVQCKYDFNDKLDIAKRNS